MFRNPKVGAEFNRHGEPKGIRQARNRKAAKARRAAVRTQRPILPLFPTLKSYTPKQTRIIRAAKTKVANDLGRRGVVPHPRLEQSYRNPDIDRYLTSTHSERVLAPYRRAGAFKVPVELDGKTFRVKRSEAGEYRKPLKVSGDNTRSQKAIAAKALRVAGTPNNAIAGATHAALSGDSPIKGAKKGVKERTTFSDVLDKDLGVKGPAKHILGFGLDVLTDPTTYLSAGAVPVARKATQDAAKGAYKRAQAKGLSEEQSRRFAARAARQEAKKPHPGKRLEVGVGRKRVKVATVQRKRAQKQGGVFAEIGERLSPRYVHPQADEGAQVIVRRAAARQRAKTGRGEAKYLGRARETAKRISTREQEQINDALEGYTVRNGKKVRFSIRDLPDHLHPIAKRQRDDYRHQRRVKAKAGAGGAKLSVRQPGEAKGYVARERRQDVDPDFPKSGRGVRSSGVADVGERKLRQPMADIRREQPDLFTEEPGLAYGAKGVKATRGAAQAETNRTLVSTGRKLDRRAKWDSAREGIYHVPAKGGKPRELVEDDKLSVREVEAVLRSPQERIVARQTLDRVRQRLTQQRKKLKAASTKAERKQIKRKIDRLQRTAKRAAREAEAPKDGQYVILNRKVVEDAYSRGGPVTPKSKLARGYDRVQGGWKTLATVVRPAYHGRNFLGDNFNAWLEQNAVRLTGNLGRGFRAGPAIHRLREADASLDVKPKASTSNAGTKVGGKKVTYDELADRFLATGAGDAGFYGGDIPSMLQRAKGGKGPVERARRLGQGRENVTRFATFIHGLKRGLSDDEAADLSRELHFDYGDLSATEKQMRRVFPFYTFTARNTPLQGRKLITRPGKYATVEKARENLAKASGLDTSDEHSYERQLKEFERNAVPFPTTLKVNVGDREVPILAQLGLPLNDLNRFTLPRSFQGLKNASVEQLQQVGSMVTFYKVFAELPANHSLFFRDEIDQGRLIGAPSWVGWLPKSVQKEIGARQQVDKKSGKRVWKWKPKWDYFFKQLPETSFVLNQTTPGKNRRGQDRVLQIAGSTGVRPFPFDSVENKIQRTYAAKKFLEDKRFKTEAGSAERKRISDKVTRLDKQLTRLSKRAKYKVPLGQIEASKRARKGGGSSGGWGAVTGGGSSGGGSSSGGWGAVTGGSGGGSTSGGWDAVK